MPYTKTGFLECFCSRVLYNIYITEVVEHAHMPCLFQLQLRHMHARAYPIVLSVCLSRPRRAPVLVGLTLLHEHQLSSYGWIDVIISLLDRHVTVMSDTFSHDNIHLIICCFM